MRRRHDKGSPPTALFGQLLRLCIPPIVFKGMRFIRDRSRAPLLEYARDGWQTRLDESSNQGWSVDSAVEAATAKWDAFRRNLEGPGPLGFSHEHADLSVTRDSDFHNVHISFAYVVALAAHKRDRISILDWGGSLGHYYLVAKAILPDVCFDYHVKEVPLMAEAGRKLNPDVHWHDDEGCLDQGYDLVMLNGSLLYAPDWADVLQRVASSAREYLFLFRLPVVQTSESFVSIERLHGSQMLHLQPNQAELMAAIRETGLTLVREFVVGEPPYIQNAPEQCEMRGWLLKREAPRGGQEQD